jgi:hypothetical protein
MRIGLNSGPTTAGVLRGEKSRFQLFGDVSAVKGLCQRPKTKEYIDASPHRTMCVNSDGEYSGADGKQWCTKQDPSFAKDGRAHQARR